MSIKDDVARLKRLGNPRSQQWEKARVSIEGILIENVFQFLPRTSSRVVRTDLPWDYFLEYKSPHEYLLRKLTFGRGRLLLKISNDSSDVSDIILFAQDIHDGWLDKVREHLKTRYNAQTSGSR
jgi:hypothetical protein